MSIDTFESASPAPSGSTANFDNPPFNAILAITLVTFFLTLGSVTVVLRLLVRYKTRQMFWWDDACSVAGWIGFVVVSGILLGGIQYGGGKDLWNVSATDAAKFSELFFVMEIISCIGILFTKLSITAQYLRLFRPARAVRDKTWGCIWTLIWFNMLLSTAVVTIVVICYRKSDRASSKCVNFFGLLISVSGITVVSDIITFIVPLYAIFKLHMPVVKKIKIWRLFAIAFLAVVASVARLIWQSFNADSPNYTYVLDVVTIMDLGEQVAGIIVGCVPVFPALYQFFFGPSMAGRGRAGASDIALRPLRA